MIFVTTGTQDPFDRFIQAIDLTLPYMNGVEVVGQVAKSDYQVKNFVVHEFLSPKDFEECFSRADLIVAHAGMGTIISALVKEKPILVMPRLAKFGEQRNDHQLATAMRFDKLGYINVAYDEVELMHKLKTIQIGPLKPMFAINDHASKELISSLSNFINL